MNIKGLDYNTQREKLVLPEYGREVQNMADYAVGLKTKAERLRCAYTIVATMERMFPQVRESADYKQKLWDHLALMTDFKLDIDWPYDVSEAKVILDKPQAVPYPMSRIPVRHYGSMVFELFDQLKTMDELFDQLKTMEPGPERDHLVALTANQMKRDLVQWSHGYSDNEKVADDLARYTDGKIQLDLDTFKFEKINTRERQQPAPSRKRKRK